MNSTTQGFSQICFQTETDNVCLSVQDLTQIQTTNGQQAINTQGPAASVVGYTYGSTLGRDLANRIAPNSQLVRGIGGLLGGAGGGLLGAIVPSP